MVEKPKTKSKINEKVEIALKFILVVAVLLAFGKMYFIDSNSANFDDETKHKEASLSRENFAKCLNEKGLIMYGIDTCEYCQAQKKMFGSAFGKINYINCDFDKEKCKAAEITGYPMWTNGENKITGLQKFANLSALTGCAVPIENSVSQ